jgi:hypothetical protein
MRTCSPMKIWLMAILMVMGLLAGSPAFAQENIAWFEVDDAGDYLRDPDDPWSWGCQYDTPNDCTLRDALYWSNYWSQHGYTSALITFDPTIFGGDPQTITMWIGEVNAAANISIQGPAHGVYVEVGNFHGRFLEIKPNATVTISKMTMQNFGGPALDGGTLVNNGTLNLWGVSIKQSQGRKGGAIYNKGKLSLHGVIIEHSNATEDGGAIYSAAGPSSELSLADVTITEGSAAASGGAVFNQGIAQMLRGAIRWNGASLGGGAIQNGGSFTIDDASIGFNNALSGGAIGNDGTLIIRNSQIYMNSAGAGGGLTNHSGTTLIERSQLYSNSASSVGGAISNHHGRLSVVSSTFYGNSAAVAGSALHSDAFSDPAAPVDVVQSSFVSNLVGQPDAPGGALYAATSAPVRLKNSIVAGTRIYSDETTDGPYAGDCVGEIYGSGYNLDTADPANPYGACQGAVHTTVDALKFSYEYDGWIAKGSSAIDHTDCRDLNGQLLTVDKTGYPIPYGGACDAGAYEYRPADTDGDGVGDDIDNCTATANPLQEDYDHDGIGNACDDDLDGDGVTDTEDGSPFNEHQCSDTDHDSCDDCASGTFNPADDGPDNDGDGICNAGDSDLDTDGDGILDVVDAFPYDRNACGDSDHDSCDDCAVLGHKDASNDGPDSDGDGVCNAGEVDDDNDGVADAADNCPATANADQADLNGNGLGDACDTALYGHPQVIASNLRNVRVTGNFVSLARNFVSGPIALPFAFRFYGQQYSSLRVSSSGFVTFDDSNAAGCCSAQGLPTPGAPNNMIVGYWEDLVTPFAPGLDGEVRYQTLGVAPARLFVVGFYAITHYPIGNHPVTFEIILHEQGNKIEVQYGGVSDDRDGEPASAGIENADGTVGVTIGVGEQALADFLANRGFLITPAFPAAPVDSDGDGVADSADSCPADPAKIAPGACGCGAVDADPDGDGVASCVDTDDDNDGIVDAIDRNKTTGADESTVASNDYRKDATTFGSVTRNGWTVTLADGANGIDATLSGAGSAPALISACDGRAKQIVLDAAGESARWHCENSSIVVDALTASSKIQVEKLYTTGQSSGWKVVGTLSTGQYLKTGSPWTNGDSGGIPVTIVDSNGTEVGSFTLDPNESVDVNLTDGANGGASVEVEVLDGTVTVSAFGQTQTMNSGDSGTFSADTEPPAIICAQPDGLWHNGNVSIACTATDSGTGLANATDAAFSLGTNVAAGSETANATTGGKTVCDAAGNCATQPAIGGIKVDRKAPSISCASPDGQWHSANVSLGCTASDGGSGLASEADASFALVTNVAPGTENANASTNARTVCDAAGNCTTQPAIGGNKIDRRAPAMTCSTDAPSLWPANHKLVAITASVKIDGVVSLSGFTLKSVTSSEPDNGLGDGDTAGDVQGWTIGTADVSGQLRAERSGKGAGRTYTLTFESRDAAGNAGTCSTTVVVPHNGGK